MQSPIPLRSPLENDSLSRVLTRVAYQLVVRDYKRNPHMYVDYPPFRVQVLSVQYGEAGFLALAAYLRAAARNIANGSSLAEWRASVPAVTGRSVYKQQWKRR